MYVRMCVHAYICVSVYVYVCVGVYRMCVPEWVRVRVCGHVYIYLYVCVCVCVCVAAVLYNTPSQT